MGAVGTLESTLIASQSLKEGLYFLPSGINYCALNKPGCEHECVNTEEGHYCRCRRGYTLDPNGKTCSREYAPGVWVPMGWGPCTVCWAH